ncbi:unnamed protein product [Coregonus sp. 'balchen']|nr:unnamed protein product [Coregonus sp. 'balchen']
MKFLHLLSTEVSQDITFHCLSEPPFSPTDTYSANGPGQEYQDRPPRFRGWNGQMFEADTLLAPLLDECKDSYELPIVDIQEPPSSQLNHLRHLESSAEELNP